MLGRHLKALGRELSVTRLLVTAVHHSGTGGGRKDEKPWSVSRPEKGSSPGDPVPGEVILNAGGAGIRMSGTTQESGFLLIGCAQVVDILMSLLL